MSGGQVRVDLAGQSHLAIGFHELLEGLPQLLHGHGLRAYSRRAMRGSPGVSIVG